uniref:Ig-like domain-containing protein n=1 Tax=Scophthalmus maximus TaxID=52904 RepID=A0A8D3B617_SCOMX
MKTTLLFLSMATVAPDTSQYFEYEQVIVLCEHSGSDQWTLWRYTTIGSLSHCGSGWGSQTSSSCDLNAVKPQASGFYWCQSEHGHSSNVVNITITGQPVILQSPVRPVAEGHDVTLHCKTKTPLHNPTVDFYKDGALVRAEPTGHMTIHHVSKSDEGAYTCVVGGLEPSPPAWLLVADDLAPASLAATPDSSQLIEYDNLSLSCGDNSSSHGWSVKRFTSVGEQLSSCGEKWGTPTSSGCVLQTVKQPDSAVYWCESPSRQRSNSVNVTVHDKPVVLLSPVLPVAAGDIVTLHCRTKNAPSSLPVAFYKDGSHVSDEPAAHMTIYDVSKSDEGAYTCDVRGLGRSPPGWLFVRDGAAAAAAPTPTVFTAIRCIVVSSPYLISTLLLVSRYRQRPAGDTHPSINQSISQSVNHIKSYQHASFEEINSWFFFRFRFI